MQHFYFPGLSLLNQHSAFKPFDRPVFAIRVYGSRVIVTDESHLPFYFRLKEIQSVDAFEIVRLRFLEICPDSVERPHFPSLKNLHIADGVFNIYQTGTLFGSFLSYDFIVPINDYK